MRRPLVAWRGRRVADGGTVVVLDPDADAREIASLALARGGLRVVTAASGPAALDALRGLVADGASPIVVGELYVPADGERCALRVLKRDPALSRLAFLVYSAHALPADRAWALENGCDAYLAKPAPPDALLREVGRLAAGRLPA